jgi:hypothetical protein
LLFFAPAPGRQAACSFKKLENFILNHHTLPAKDFRFPVASRKSEFAGVLRFGRFRWPPRLDSLFLEKNYISGERPARLRRPKPRAQQVRGGTERLRPEFHRSKQASERFAHRFIVVDDDTIGSSTGAG